MRNEFTSGRLRSVLGKAAAGAGAAAVDAARNTDQREAVDRLTRALASNGDPASMTDDQHTNAVTVLIQRRVQNGSSGSYVPIEASMIQRPVPPTRQGAAFGARRSLLVAAAPCGAALGGLML